MANRLWTQFFYSFLKAPVGIFASASINADASVASFSGKGVSSVAKTGTGEYTITLQDTYFGGVKSIQFQLSGATPEDLVPWVVSADVTSSGEIVVQLLTAGVATDPTEAVVLYMDLVMENSSVS